MLTAKQRKQIREKAKERAKPQLDLIREKLPEAALSLSGDRLALRTSVQGQEVGVTYFDVNRLLETDYVRGVVVNFEGKVNAIEADIESREAIKELLVDLASGGE